MLAVRDFLPTHGHIPTFLAFFLRFSPSFVVPRDFLDHCAVFALVPLYVSSSLCSGPYYICTYMQRIPLIPKVLLSYSTL